MAISPKIVQQRGTIFINQIIGYTPENEKKFKSLLLPDGVVSAIRPSIQQGGVVAPLPLTIPPQFGMPWQLRKELGESVDGSKQDLCISFFPGKVDIVLNKVGDIGEIDNYLLNLCKEQFRVLREESFEVTRLAYCPLYSLVVNSSILAEDYWKLSLKKTSSMGIPMQNRELSYVLKNDEIINGKPITMNFLHQIKDGYHVTKGIKDADCILISLDINSVAENSYRFEVNDMNEFWALCPRWTAKLLDNIF